MFLNSDILFWGIRGLKPTYKQLFFLQRGKTKLEELNIHNYTKEVGNIRYTIDDKVQHATFVADANYILPK